MRGRINLEPFYFSAAYNGTNNNPLKMALKRLKSIFRDCVVVRRVYANMVLN